MNVLLFFPAFGVLLWKAEGAWLTILNLIVMGGIQVSDKVSAKLASDCAHLFTSYRAMTRD
jgi:hypothetical protein